MFFTARTRRAWLPLLTLILVFVLGTPTMGQPLARGSEASAVSSAATVKEGGDFATQVLRDPWDMSEYSDISQWINHAGSSNDLLGIDVSGGLFSATTRGSYSEFYPLFPGYEPGLIMGKTGAAHPINSSQHHCLSLAMKAEIPEATDYFFTIFWAADRTVDWGVNAVWGQTYGNKLVNNTWKLYEIDLATWPLQVGTRWNQRAQWQGLRVSPVLQRPNTKFLIDWIRLTDCAPVTHTLTGLPSGDFSLWVGTGSPERQILVVDSFQPSGGQYNWDVQGLASGVYDYYVKNAGGGTVKQGQITIDGAPIVHFVRPSPLSGEDYSTQAGNPWDMHSSNDLKKVKCATSSTVNDLLLLDTVTPSQAPNCVRSGANEMDPNVQLNTPTPADIRAYRYLSFRHLINGSWSVPELGMVVRWIWATSNSGPDCHYVTREVALEVFWDTYMVDLHDAYNGLPVESDPPNCPMTRWKDQSLPVVLFRIDPNENITSSTFHQEIDWIRLTKVDSIGQGQPFPVMVNVSEPVGQLQSLTFYYTSTPTNPTQHPAKAYSNSSSGGLGANPFAMFLPAVRHGLRDPFVEALQADFTFKWDTGGVAPGLYYLCARANDGANNGTYCSAAPVEVQ